MRYIAFLWMLFLVATVGCNTSGTSGTDTNTDTSSSAPNSERGTIAYSALTLKNPFFNVISDSIYDEAHKHGFDYVVDDAGDSVEKQSQQIETYIAQGHAAIIISPAHRESIGKAVKKANDAGIPVFTCDLQCVAEGCDIAAHVGTDNYGGGKLAGQAMVDAIGDTGGKVLILHFPQANSCILRVDGFKEVINAHNEKEGTAKIEIVAEPDGGGDTEKGSEAAAAALQTDTDLVGIFAINDPSALGAYRALEEAGKTDQVTIIGFDGQLSGKRAIKEGKIHADPIQFPDQIGREIMKRVVSYFDGEPYEKVTLIPTQLYTQKDAEQDPELQDSK